MVRHVGQLRVKPVGDGVEPASPYQFERTYALSIESDIKRIVVICVGNILLLDEGFGPRVAEHLLHNYVFPAQVDVLDRGVMGLAMLGDIRDAGAVLIIDALDNTGQPPGTIMSFTPADLDASHSFRGSHDMRLTDVFAAAALLDINPEVSCLGVQVADWQPAEYTIGLTEPVAAALEPMCDLVLDWLAAHGATAVRADSISSTDGTSNMTS